MSSDLELPRKYSLRIAGRKIVFRKRSDESADHVRCKALAVALYSDEYPDTMVEQAVGDRYKPDLVSMSASGEPAFWAECGQVGKRKIEALLRRYPRTHFVFLKYGSLPVGFVRIVERAADRAKRTAPVDLVALPSELSNQIDPDGTVSISLEDCEVRRLW